ncbi:aspartate--tRNA ligase [Verrucomicrobiales bacterium]|nr:aspartate--tRNA ligase [Verrucomicrobiales bacterium]
MRTHNCNELRKDHIGQTATIIGWVNTKRDHHGVIFIDIRDREGITQSVFRSEENAEAAKISHGLRQEDIVRVTGIVSERPEIEGQSTVNPNIETGEIELVANALEVINRSEVLPFQLDKELSNEDLRLKHRYLDLRRERMSRNLKIRHRVAKSCRDFLDEADFLEIETPILSKSTPEGARDFLVPSRLNPGKFYALPQAPQQYKQLLQVAGVEKYFQIARCFRDEDLRADRQPEFTQVDIEASFITTEDIIGLIEGLLSRCFTESINTSINLPFPRMTYKEALERFGSDKPDTRFGMELIGLNEVFSKSEFKVFSGAIKDGGEVKAINAKNFACVTTGQMNHLTETAQLHGAKGLAFIKVEDGEWKSPIVKFFSEEEKASLTEAMSIEEGDLILFGAGDWQTVCEVLGRIRLECSQYLELTKDNDSLNFLWVTEFPLLAIDNETGKWNAVHHPFTRPKAEDQHLLDDESNFGDIRAEAYDVVLNGNEIGGGSIRIHESSLQSKMFSALGINEDQAKQEFGHLLDAFSFGAPPSWWCSSRFR